MAKLSEDQVIRNQLRLLQKRDREVILVSMALSKLLGIDDPEGPLDLMDRRQFIVEKTNYHGWMTDQQFTFLDGQKKSKEEFRKAIFAVHLELEGKLYPTLTDIGKLMGIEAISASKTTARQIPDPSPGVQPGCCTLDGEKQSTSKALCDACHGHWDPEPCDRIKPPKGKDS